MESLSHIELTNSENICTYNRNLSPDPLLNNTLSINSVLPGNTELTMTTFKTNVTNFPSESETEIYYNNNQYC